MLESTANWALAILGISFLIFMHELGHFLAARCFKVRVETFSIGFGPRIFGFTSGDTEYRFSAIPLGGYVKMAGEYGDYRDDEPLEAGDLMSTPIWQRAIIFSGGVVMNFLLAALIFPLAFGLGVPFHAPVVGSVTPAGPAWQAGLRTGDEILAVDGQKIWGFSDVLLEVALGDPDGLSLDVQRGEQRLDLEVTPQRLSDRWDIGVFAGRDAALVVIEGGPAEAAGLLEGDRLLAVNGLGVGSLDRGAPLSPELLLLRGFQTRAPVDVRVLRERPDGGDQQLTITIEPRLLPADEGSVRLLGAMALETRVAGLRGGAPGSGLGLRLDDVLLSADGKPLYRIGDIYDSAAAAGREGLALRILRDGVEQQLQLRGEELERLRDGQVAFGSTETIDARIQLLPGGSLEAAGVPTGATIVALDGTPMRTFKDVTDAMKADRERVDWNVKYRYDGVEHEVAVRTAHQQLYDYGLGLRPLMVRYEVSLVGALGAGWDATVNALRTTGLTLGKLFTGDVGIDNLGGPISIGVITKEAASNDIARLLFFLALLSVNLGFINILPVPVLDGGQIVFLLCEKVKGSRLSERFMVNANIAGFVAILVLMAFVTFNDVSNLF